MVRNITQRLAAIGRRASLIGRKGSKTLCAVAIAAVITLGLAGCPDPTNNNPEGDPELSGSITIAPASATTGTELTATYSGTEAVTYQWKKGNDNVGTNSNKYTPTEAGSYTVTVSASGYQSKTSAAVTVTGSSLTALTGTITIAPASAETGTELTATYSGGETVTYQWKKGNDNVGTNSNKYTPTDAGSYTVTVSATGYTPKTSDAVTVTALSTLAGAITIAPASAETGTELTATYSGGETVTYQWKKDGNNVASGGTSQTFTPIEAGSYTVTVSATGYESKTSDPVTVIALAALDGTITITPNSNVITGTELTAAYSGSETGIDYQWKKDGSNVTTGGTGQTFTPTEAGDYTVTVSATGFQDKTSDPVTVIQLPGNNTVAAALENKTGDAAEGWQVSLSTYIADGDAYKQIFLDIAAGIPEGSIYLDLSGSICEENLVPSFVYDDDLPQYAGLVLPDSLTTIGRRRYRNLSSLNSISAANVVTIDREAFMAQPGESSPLVSADFPKATDINYRAFYGCSALKTVNFPNATTINEAFFGCSALESVTIPEAVSIVGYAFNGCSALTEVSLPKVTAIPGGTQFGVNSFVGVFAGCTSLEKVDLSSATSIGTYAFARTGATALTITLGAIAPTLAGAESFISCPIDKEVTVMHPAGATGYDYASGSESYDDWGHQFKGEKDSSTSGITLTIETITP